MSIKPIVDPARHATYRVPSHGHLLHLIPIQGLSFTTTKYCNFKHITKYF